MNYSEECAQELANILQREMRNFIEVCVDAEARKTVSGLLQILIETKSSAGLEDILKKIQTEFDFPRTSVTDMLDQNEGVFDCMRRVSRARKELSNSIVKNR
jgi:hypothetical protein